MTLDELRKIKRYTDMAIHKFNLELRKVRRNKALIQERYDATPIDIIKDLGIESPDEQIESIKEDKDSAVFVKKQIERAICQKTSMLAHNKVKG